MSVSPIRAKFSPNSGVQARTATQGRPTSLSMLSDVDLTTLEDGATLIYNVTTNKFEARRESTSFLAELTSAASSQTVHSWSSDDYRTSKLVLQILHGSDIQCTEILLTHDGEDAYIVEYGTIQTGAALGVFSAAVNDGNVNLIFSPSFTNTTVRGLRNSLLL
jgi:hypothetical protein